MELVSNLSMIAATNDKIVYNFTHKGACAHTQVHVKLDKSTLYPRQFPDYEL